MDIFIKDNHIIVVAKEGNYVGLKDESVFGEALSLGIGKTPEDCIEKPINEWEILNEININEEIN